MSETDRLPAREATVVAGLAADQAIAILAAEEIQEQKVEPVAEDFQRRDLFPKSQGPGQRGEEATQGQRQLRPQQRSEATAPAAQRPEETKLASGQQRVHRKMERKGQAHQGHGP